MLLDKSLIFQYESVSSRSIISNGCANINNLFLECQEKDLHFKSAFNDVRFNCSNTFRYAINGLAPSLINSRIDQNYHGVVTIHPKICLYDLETDMLLFDTEELKDFFTVRVNIDSVDGGFIGIVIDNVLYVVALICGIDINAVTINIGGSNE